MGNLTDVDEVQVKRVSRIANKYYNEQKKELSLTNLKKEWKVVFNLRDWTNLQILKLRACGVDNSDMKLLTSQRFPHLKILDLDSNFLSIKGLIGLTNRKFPQLEQLSLNENYLKNEGISQMLISKEIKQLKSLCVGYNNISSMGIVNIKKAMAPKIINLQFNRNDIGSFGCKLLSKANMPTLQTLSLKQCQIGNEGIKHLIKANWPNLNILNISCDEVNGEGIYILTTSRFKKLKKIYIDRIDPITFLSFIERTDLLCALSDFLINGSYSFTALLQSAVNKGFS